MGQRILFTVGHSTRPWADFVKLLQNWKIQILVDVRTIPRSRNVPRFSKNRMKSALAMADIQYIHLSALGGLRHSTKQSINTGWRNASFRGYGDYMQTPEFQAALAELNRWRKTKRTCVMCAEAVWWRCHRRMIADAEVAVKIPVRHIMTPLNAPLHKITEFALVKTRRGHPPVVTYPQKFAGPSKS